jgi:CRP/FNR family transcriptional regulator
MLSKDQIQRLDRHFPVLTKLNTKDRDILFSAGQIVELPEEQMLMQQSQQCQFVPFVLSGVLRIYKLSPNGREMTLYRTLTGETCLASIACQLTGDEFPAMAQVEETAELFMVPSKVYHEVLDKQLAWKDFLINSMYSHLIETMQTFERWPLTGLTIDWSTGFWNKPMTSQARSATPTRRLPSSSVQPARLSRACWVN